MRALLFIAAVALAAGCSKSDPPAAAQASPAAAPAPAADENLAKMTVDEVDRDLQAKRVVPVDCNSDRTRKKKGVLPGAILVSDEESYAASELPADKSTKLVFYCADAG